MMAWIKARKDIDYIIVYHFNRIFRNSIDAAITKKELAKYGCRVVSTVLDMGESPESAMVESIIHAVDQYQSQASGADIRYKMGQKVKNGGSVGMAPLGYLNVRESKPEGGEIRTVTVDPERGSLITKAFELFGTGQYTGPQLHTTMTTAGLTTRGTRRTAPKPLSLNKLYDILSDRYYLGMVEYHGEEFKGRHQPLVTPELFERVQRVLALHGGGGTRARKHHHWLKGLLACGRCEKRLIVMPGKGNGGTYFYFMCRGRQKHTCDLPYLKVQDVETAVESHYATVRLSDSFRTSVRSQLDDTVLTELSSIQALKQRLTARLGELDAQEDNYLDLVGKPGWPEAKLQKKLAAVAAERTEIGEQLADTTSKLHQGRQFFTLALDLLRDPQGFYKEGNANVKHALTKVIFSKLYFDMTDTAMVSGHDLTEGVGDLVAAEQQRRTLHRRSDTLSDWEGSWNDSRPVLTDGPALADLSTADLLAWSVDQGSSKAVLVGLTWHNPNSLVLVDGPELTIQPPHRRYLRTADSDHQSGHDQAKHVIAGYQAGATVYELADHFGIDRKTVSRILRRHEVPMRRTGLTAEQVDQAVHLHQNGWSTAQIAEQLDSTQRTIQRRLAERGITTQARQTEDDV